MRIAFLNLCHCDPELVARAARRLTSHPDFDMYIHIDAKADADPFCTALSGCEQVFFIEKRRRVYWGGFNAVEAIIGMMREALASQRKYDYFVTLQNLDYPLRSNNYIHEFFSSKLGVEFIRACDISGSKDRHFTRKYRIYNKRDDDFYLAPHSRLRMLTRYFYLLIRSIPTMLWSGVIREGAQSYRIHYGAAQWAVTRECAEYLVAFFDAHPVFNSRMAHIQFPDEEYFHTAVHNSPFKLRCSSFSEPERRWLVNWRNLHYFEYPKEVTVLTESDYEKLSALEDELFVRKVRSDVSDTLMDLLDAGMDNS